MDKRKLAGLKRRNPRTAIDNTLRYRVQAEARKRNIPFSLSKEDFYNLSTSNCHYCGDPPKTICYPTVKLNGKRSKTSSDYSRPSLYNGIDRVDNTRGYEIDNVVPCCKLCNYAKRDLTVKEFFNLISKIYLLSVEKNTYRHKQ